MTGKNAGRGGNGGGSDSVDKGPGKKKETVGSCALQGSESVAAEERLGGGGFLKNYGAEERGKEIPSRAFRKGLNRKGGKLTLRGGGLSE